MPKSPKSARSQSTRFEEAARDLGCDESEERFDAALKKVAAHKATKPARTSRAKTAKGR